VLAPVAHRQHVFTLPKFLRPMFSRHRAWLGARLMAVYGTVGREGEVVHVIAGWLADHSDLLGRLATSSRDFH